MKVYQKMIIAVFVIVFMLAGARTAFSNMPSERVSAQTDEMQAPVPGAVPVMQADEVPVAQADTPTLTPIPYPTVSPGSPIVIIDYAKYAAWLAVGANDKYIMLEVLKVKKDKNGAITSSTISSQYAYDLLELTKSSTQKGLMVDLSFLTGTSEQYIRVYGNSNPANAVLVQINAQPKKPSLKYAGGQFTAKIDKKDTVLNATQLDTYEYRTLYGASWDSLKNFNGTTSAIAGTTLLIREKATATTPAGAEQKLKIAAAAKAPKVAIDYVKGVISIPKGVEVKIFLTGKEGNWATFDAAAKLTPAELLEKFVPYVGGALTSDNKTAALETTGFSIIARTAAVEKDGVVTKGASQPIFVDIPATTKVTKVANENKIVGSTSTIYLTYQNVDKGIEMLATGGGFDYSVDNGKTWKALKADAKKATVAAPKDAAVGILIRQSGAKATATTLAKLPSSNWIAAAWLPPLTLTLSGASVGTSDTITVTEGEAMEIFVDVKQGKETITGATVSKTNATTLPNMTVAAGKLNFTVPAYNESGTNNYVIEVTATKTGYTAGTVKLNVTVTKKQ